MVGKKKIFLIVFLTFMAALGNLLHFKSTRSTIHIDLARLSLEDEDIPYVEEPMDESFLEELGAEDAIFRVYKNGAQVWVFIGFFTKQKEGSQIHSPKHCYPGSGWNIVAEKEAAVAWGKGKIKQIRVENAAGERRMVYYWFQTKREILNNVFVLKVRQVQRAFLGKSLPVFFVRISTPLYGDTVEAGKRLDRFAAMVEKEISKLSQQYL